MDDKRILDILQSLTLEEKATLCGGYDNWTTCAIPEKGVTALRMADGPHGVRVEAGREVSRGYYSNHASCFPTASALACSWNPSLAHSIGEHIAAECREQGVDILLGPGVNIKRSPLCGRNFEYYSEDPLLAGEMAAGLINGLQQNGVAASLKHYAANNQEHKRMSISAAIDERSLFDLYLKPFEIAIKKSRPATVMCSYNKLEGTYASENRRLLTDILRLRFGFDGLVMSDWGAVNSRPAGIAAGLDLEMPGSGGVNTAAIIEAVKNATLAPEALDAAVWNLLRLVLRYSKITLASSSAPSQGTAQPAAVQDLPVEAATQSMVLLKNEGGLLPFDADTKDSIAFMGPFLRHPRIQGGGSSLVNPQRNPAFPLPQNSALHRYDDIPTGQTAADIASSHQTVVLFLGLPDIDECEGYDRDTLMLMHHQNQLVDAATQHCKHVCVVLFAGGPVQMPWLDKVQAVVYAGLAGEGSGEALSALMFGQRNFSGKLAETWPLRIEDTPAFAHFPMGDAEVSYNESLYVGYRYYNTVGQAVAFPFGHGLSYTSFAYSDISTSTQTLAEGDTLSVDFTLKNTGSVPGEEIAQLYLRRDDSAMWCPSHELLAFERVSLAPGQSKLVSFQIPWQSFACHDPASGTQVVETGNYTLELGSSSRELPLRAVCRVSGVTLSPSPAFAKSSPYAHITDNNFPQELFAQIHPALLRDNTPIKKGDFTLTTTLGEMQQSWWARRVLAISRRFSQKHIHFSPHADVNTKVANCITRDLPVKNLPLQTGGRISPAATQLFLDLCNGRGSAFRLLAEIIKRPDYLKKNVK